MKRILLSATTLKDDRYWYQLQLFSGVAFDVKAAGEVEAFQVVDGRVAEQYLPVCILDGGDYTQIDAGGQLSDYDLVYHLGRPYTGIAYEFSGQACGKAAFVRNGVIVNEAHWNSAGLMIYLDAPNPRFGELYEWHDNGQLKRANISTNDRFYGGFGFSRDGHLMVMSGSNGFLANLEEISGLSRHLPVRSMRDIFDLSVPEEISLVGNDIDGHLLDEMNSRGFLEKVKSLSLSNVSAEYLDLAAMPDIEEVHFLSSTVDQSDLIASIKKQSNNVCVFLRGWQV